MESVVIFSLSLWIVEEYLNNMYLREYVSGVFQADGLMIGLLGTLLVFGSFSTLMLRRTKHGAKKFGAVSLEATPPTAPNVRLSAEANTKPVEASAKPRMDIHPLVAALQADLADRRPTLGPTLRSTREKNSAPSQ